MPKEMTVQPITRRIEYNGTPLMDLNPDISAADVVRLHATTMPALTTAEVTGPTMDGDVQVYKVNGRVATKG